ncbi:MAG TPA: ATP-dependent Clp protease ATP-binding subunit [Candidatus Magasanikbacteria bacterium]|nr:ATP-dependent Clp protease ATP-binding subunit [Candidatus Magasanikbacteria bacterium]
MLFSRSEQLPILSCTVCGGTGKDKGRRCPECRGFIQGILHNGFFAYFGEQYTHYAIELRKSRRGLNAFRIIGAIVIGLGSFALFFYFAYHTNRMNELDRITFWLGPVAKNSFRALVWIGCLAFLYLWYRILREKTPPQQLLYHGVDNTLPHTQDNTPVVPNWKEVFKMSSKQYVNISTYLSPEARSVLEKSFQIAREYGVPQILPMHLMYTLLSDSSVAEIGIRLHIPMKSLQAMIGKTFGEKKKIVHSISPTFSPEMQNIIFRSYLFTREKHDPRIRVTTLFKLVVEQSEQIQEILYDIEVDKTKLDNVIEWARIRETMHENYRVFARASAGVSKHGMDKAMTAVATPALNQMSHDLTIAAKYGDIDICVARDKEIEEILRIIEGGGRNIMLVGDHGVGKVTIVQGIVERMIRGDVPKLLQDKRMVQLSATSLLAGTTVAGAEERLIRIMNEITRARNIILFIDNIHDLIGITDGSGQGLDVSESLAEYLSADRFVMFATTLPDTYARFIAHSEIGTVFSKIDVREMEINQAIRVLESKAGTIEYKTRVFYSYDAVEKSVQLAHKFFTDRNLPESALALMSEAGSYARSKHGEHCLVSPDDVGAVVADKTGIPATSITANESEKLLKLEEEMHTQVIGQSEAVALVANALRRARADMRSTTRPISSFLFLGPTGVGKTELAKTIARVYFGGEARMIRIDMSEYQDSNSMYRLIGQVGAQGSGILTQAVKDHPFSLVLLDEFEKADPNILNLFLQVLDDGRLTDSTGRVVDFTNTIIIATSNAGTEYVSRRMKEGATSEEVRQELIRGELKSYYRPELLNRFDGIVLFKPLMNGEIKQIAKLMLKQVEKDLEIKGVGFHVEDAALDELARVGFDPEFGARPMRRAIQDRVENELANLVLKGELQRRDIIVLGEGLMLRVEKPVS